MITVAKVDNYCYKVYSGRGWSLAEDHIHFTIGRQAASLKQVYDAVQAFEKLLNAYSKQPAPQQATFLREFLHIHNVGVDITCDSFGPRVFCSFHNNRSLRVIVTVSGRFSESSRASYFAFTVNR